jgi:glycosyltransferase involved in cell wall biosynthesis
MKISIAHLTSVHSRYDIRIFFKECRSLVVVGYEVTLVVADGKGNEVKDQVMIQDIGKPVSRLSRFISTTRAIYLKAIELDADIYHLHDPELIPIGIKLKKNGKKVIFDAHEDLPKQILSKPYLNKPIKVILSFTLRFYEIWACRKFDAVVAATPFIRDKFLSINSRTLDVNNFPILGELNCNGEVHQKKRYVCYVGGISSIRGIGEMVAAMGLLETGLRLQLAGRFSEPDLHSEVTTLTGWSFVDELGFLDRPSVKQVVSQSIAGLVLFHDLPNHTNAQPNKLFEYMSAGIPVIASNFPLWREIVLGNSCGLCVDPMDPAAIADAIDFLASHPDEARRMGENGRLAVQERYNWAAEEIKLLAVYADLAEVGT